MGIESFWVHVSPVHTERLPLLEPYRAYLNIAADGDEISMQGALLCFLPACEMMFRACRELQVTRISSYDNDRDFDFHDFTSLFAWIYSLWKKKLAHFNAEFGTLLLPPAQYYDARRRLAKYCPKIPDRKE